MQPDRLRELHREIASRIGSVVVAQEENVRLLLVALLARGHVLLESVPGTGKTLLAKSFAASLALVFKRIQFTPDLMPGDVIGTNLFDFQKNAFVLTRGPIFTEVLLADEINRTPPKTQAALLEAMQERDVTLDGRSYPLSEGFVVLATQNPIEHEGTYPLPEAQLDRFLFKLVVAAPDRDREIDVVRMHGGRTTSQRIGELGIAPACGLPEILEARAILESVRLEDPVAAYIVDLARATRSHPDLQVGASPRAAVQLATASRAVAALEGRDYVIPDDVKGLAPHLLRHRVVVAPGAEMEGRNADHIVGSLLDQVEAPR
jgi:MoxR-like ATPase